MIYPDCAVCTLYFDMYRIDIKIRIKIVKLWELQSPKIENA